jgi:hypothetical protein
LKANGRPAPAPHGAGAGLQAYPDTALTTRPITGKSFRHNRRDDFMRVVYPIKYYKDEGFVERIIELDDGDLDTIIEEYLREHGDFEFDEVEIVNKRPMNIWLHAKCHTYIDKDNPDEPEDEQVAKAEAEVTLPAAPFV